MIKDSRSISIGINGSMLDDRPTGVGTYSYNVINNLAKLYQNSCNRLSVFTPTRKALHAGLKIIKLSDSMQSSKHGNKAALIRFFWNTFIYPIQARKYDFLLSPTTHGSFFLKNQIITIHDTLALRYNTFYHQRIYNKYILPALLSNTKAVIAISESTKKDIIQFLKYPEKKIHVIYNGYDPDKYFVADDNSDLFFKKYGFKKYFLAVGPNYPHKNFEFLLNAYNKLSNTERSEYPLLIAGGKEPYLTSIRELIQVLSLQENVHYIGYIPEELMPAMYQEAFALVFPSLYEGFGLPPLEAMACGCPVIVSNTSSLPEVCDNAALYINPTDESSLVAAMKSLIEDELLYKQLKEKGLKQALKFSWKKTAESLKSLLENKTLLT